MENNIGFASKVYKKEEKVDLVQDNPKYPVLILTCMHPLMDVDKIFQLDPGDVLVLRNAGNVCTTDVKRSILIAIHQYDIEEIIILGHVDCIMTKLNMSKINEKLLPLYFNAFWKKGDNPNKSFRRYFKCFIDEFRNLQDQVKTLRAIPNLPKNINIIPFFYDLKTGIVFSLDELNEIQFINDFQNQYQNLIDKKKRKIRLLSQLDENDIIILDEEPKIDEFERIITDIDSDIENMDDAAFETKEKEYDDFIDNYIKNFKVEPKNSKKSNEASGQMFKKRIYKMTRNPEQMKAEAAVKRYQKMIESSIGPLNEKLDKIYEQFMDYAQIKNPTKKMESTTQQNKMTVEDIPLYKSDTSNSIQLEQIKPTKKIIVNNYKTPISIKNSIPEIPKETKFNRKISVTLPNHINNFKANIRKPNISSPKIKHSKDSKIYWHITPFYNSLKSKKDKIINKTNMEEIY